MKSKDRILFTYLVAFRTTGGLEKVNRTILKCLSFLKNEDTITEAWSLYDNYVDEKYFPKVAFKGFNKNKLFFAFYLIISCFKWDKIIVGHINMASLLKIVKRINPSIKIVLIIHGIEVWDGLDNNKKWLLSNANKIISVSEYTKNIVVHKYGINPGCINVMHNCLDYYFPNEFTIEKPKYLQERYQIDRSCITLLTITRINKNEERKGYDKILDVLSKINSLNPAYNFHYLLCGKYEENELVRLEKLIIEFNLENRVQFSGFIKDDELFDHYNLSDIYIMPSKKEGFGMVFIEAAACGLKVIAGNTDGSSEALLNGQTGILVNPDNVEEIYNILNNMFLNKVIKCKKISDITYRNFNFDIYKNKFLSIVNEV